MALMKQAGGAEAGPQDTIASAEAQRAAIKPPGEAHNPLGGIGCEMPRSGWDFGNQFAKS